MTLLKFFFIISGVIIIIIALDISKKQKFNALHFLIFLGVGAGLLIFTFFPNVLDGIGGVFGVARGADVLVYTSIIFLLYFVLLLLSKHVENKESITSLIRELAIENSDKKELVGEEVFLVRVYNEQEVLKDVIQNIIDNGYKNILVVNDGSTDLSSQIISTFGSKVFSLRHMKNRGAGAALETGFEYLRRYGNIEYVVTFDADGQHSIKDYEKFKCCFEKDENLGAVLGSRFIEKTDTNIPLIRKITLSLGRIFTLLVSGVFLTDAHNGYRVFKLDTVKNIKLSIDDMAYASELIEEIKKNNIKFKEVPVNIQYTNYSLKKGQSSGNAIHIAMKFIWSKFFK